MTGATVPHAVRDNDRLWVAGGNRDTMTLVLGGTEIVITLAQAREMATQLVAVADYLETCGLSCGPGHGETSKNGGQPADAKGNPPLS